MQTHSNPAGPHRVVIVGGGVAALEAALALKQLSPDRTIRTVIAPNAEYVVRAQTVREPFAFPAADRYPLAPIIDAAGAALIVDSLASVDTAAKTIVTEQGQTVPYDALVLALGARSVPRYEHALTVDHRSMGETLSEMIANVDSGTIRSLAFVGPAGPAWPLPLYELALMTAQRARDAGHSLDVMVVVPDDRPLVRFGMALSNGMATLLTERGVEVMLASEAEVPHPRQVVISPGDRQLQVDRVIALPELVGPGVVGIPQDEHGFVPVDDHARVVGVSGVFAVGDIAAHPIKHGGFSAQQADAACEAIAADAGEIINPSPVEGLLRGMILTGGEPAYFSARFAGGHAFDSVYTREPTFDASSKIAARYLSAYLDAQRTVSNPG